MKGSFSMLLGFLVIVSVVISLAGCFGCGGFGDWSWLWLLPVGFLGWFLLLLVLALLFFGICCLTVRTSVPQEKDSPFFRVLAHLVIDAILRLFRIRIHTSGMEKLPKDGRFLLACNHLSKTDPALLLWQFSKSQLAFVTKRENYQTPIVAQVMHRLMCQSLNRENDREALKTVLKCARLLKEDQVSVAVFPEGYIKPDRKLHHFRHGVFKIAQRGEVPVVVCTLQNSQYIVSNMKRLRPTDVQLHLVGVIGAEELKGTTAVGISQRVYDMMAADLGPDLVAQE